MHYIWFIKLSKEVCFIAAVLLRWTKCAHLPSPESVVKALFSESSCHLVMLASHTEKEPVAFEGKQLELANNIMHTLTKMDSCSMCAAHILRSTQHTCRVHMCKMWTNCTHAYKIRAAC